LFSFTENPIDLIRVISERYAHAIFFLGFSFFIGFNFFSGVSDEFKSTELVIGELGIVVVDAFNVKVGFILVGEDVVFINFRPVRFGIRLNE